MQLKEWDSNEPRPSAMLQEQARYLEVEIPVRLSYPDGCLKSPGISTCRYSASDDRIQRGALRETVLAAFLWYSEQGSLSISNEKSWGRQEWSTIAATFAGRKTRGKICLECWARFDEMDAPDPAPGSPCPGLLPNPRFICANNDFWWIDRCRH